MKLPSHRRSCQAAGRVSLDFAMLEPALSDGRIVAEAERLVFSFE
jgi:hypothetical protein